MTGDLFIGVKISETLDRAMASCGEIDRAFFTDPQYLIMVRNASDRYLGKLVTSGTPCASLEDIARNVTSLLARIDPRDAPGKTDLTIFPL